MSPDAAGYTGRRMGLKANELGNSMAEIILEAEALTKTYRIGVREISVLDTVSLSVSAGEFIVITGNSGSGKTTLLSVLSGLDRPTSGRVRLEGTDITELGENRLAPIRNEMIGFVFQAFHLIPSLSALENVMFPAELCKDPKAREKGRELLERVGMEERSTNLPAQLSGGEKQRVAICRALINAPRLLFADEPTGNLDSANSRDIMTLLTELHREHDATLVMATHSAEIAKQADRIIHLEDGRLVGTGETVP